MTDVLRRVGPATTEGHRLGWAACAGFALAAVSAALTLWQLAVLIGWIGGATTFLRSVWRQTTGLDAAATARIATREDDSRRTATVLVVTASLVSLVGVFVALRRAARTGGTTEVALTIAAMGTVVVSWTLVQTVFALRYAHRYYGEDAPGGIDFPGGDAPSYADFAYVAFTVGMTFQVSDTPFTDRALRRTLLRHALVSFLFGTTIIATTINVVAGLVR